MSSFQIWCLLQVSKKLARGQQRAEKASNFEKIQLGEHLATWHQVCNMISYKRDVLERQSLSEVKMGRGSPICERVRKKIVEYFKNNVPQRQIAKALQISSSTAVVLNHIPGGPPSLHILHVSLIKHTWFRSPAH